MPQKQQKQSGPWDGAPWAAWFADIDSDGNVVSPFGEDAFFPNPTQNRPDGQVMQLNPKGRGIQGGGAWASADCAQMVADTLGGIVFDGAQKMGGGWSFNQPQYLVKLPNGVDINPGTVALYFINQAGPMGGNASYLHWWLTQLTSAD